MNKIKNYMMCEIPIIIDWEKFGITTEDEKDFWIERFKKDINGTPVTIFVNDIDDYGSPIKTKKVIGYNLNAERSDDDINVLSMIWGEQTPIFITDEHGRLKINEIEMEFDAKIGQTFLETMNKMKEINDNISKKIEILMDEDDK